MNTTTKKNNLPLRRCLVTGESLPKGQLLRIVRTPDQQLLIDPTGKANGRGAYLKKDPTILPMLQKHKLIEKHLRVQPTEAFFDSLREALRG
jgi:uncharacterized protein